MPPSPFQMLLWGRAEDVNTPGKTAAKYLRPFGTALSDYGRDVPKTTDPNTVPELVKFGMMAPSVAGFIDRLFIKTEGKPGKENGGTGEANIWYVTLIVNGVENPVTCIFDENDNAAFSGSTQADVPAGANLHLRFTTNVVSHNDRPPPGLMQWWMRWREA
jgi:hypothetical protein